MNGEFEQIKNSFNAQKAKRDILQAQLQAYEQKRGYLTGRVAYGEKARIIFQPVCNIAWQHIEQHTLGFLLLLVISTYDLRHKIIPDQLSFLFGVLAFVGLFLFDSLGYNSSLKRSNS